jgi:hypothetical protein
MFMAPPSGVTPITAGRASQDLHRLRPYRPAEGSPCGRSTAGLARLRRRRRRRDPQADRGYAYFLQEWGKHSWNVAENSPIEASDAKEATVQALTELDASFFRVRFDRLTPTEKRYIRAMAELGPGPHRSGDVADVLGRKVATVAPLRNALIAKGMLYSPAHGDTAFTVPLFDGFMKRIMPLA